MGAIREALSGGDRRSLGRTEEVVSWVLAERSLLAELFSYIFDEDEIVRMRAGDALEKVAREQPEWFIPYVERLLTDVAQIDQHSVQWHLAQILGEVPLTLDQQPRAIALLKRILATYDDWIVVNLTLESLAHFARQDTALRHEFHAILKRYEQHAKKSVASRARKLLREFG